MALATTRKKRQQLSAELIECAFTGRHRDVERLLSEGADFEAVDRADYTALSEAAMAGHALVVGQLLRALADPGRTSDDGRTALHRAAFHSWIPVVRLLLEHGADPNTKDFDGATPIDLVRSPAAREVLVTFPAEKTQDAAAEHARKRALLPPPPELIEEPEEVQATAFSEVSATETAVAADLGVNSGTGVFQPPPRKSAASEAVATKAAADAKKAERERRFREAMDEVGAQYGGDTGEEGTSFTDFRPPLTARVVVSGAGEARLNGMYNAAFACKDRVEFEKKGDTACQVVWTEWHDEWRMLIGDFKLGSTLYRHKYRPNVKVDECLGVPRDGWQKWFGKDTEPLVRYLSEGDPDEEGGATLAADAGEHGPGDDPAAFGTSAGHGGAVGGKKAEYLEIHSKLEIVKPAADAIEDPLQAKRACQSRHVSVRGGERLVETADGLFGADEVGDQREGTDVEPGSKVEEAAAAWLENTGGAPDVPATLEAALEAKAAAQQLFAEGKVGDARQATTAALHAVRRAIAAAGGSDAEAGRPAATAELDELRGVLCSNRSLLVLQQIQANDREALAFGAEVAWRLVAMDASEALAADGSNFKANFRRARACFELGELEDAMADITRVVDHYSRNSKSPNPEAASLRERIMEALRKEQRKWGEKGPARWNKATAKNEPQPLVLEVGTDETPTQDRATERAANAPAAGTSWLKTGPSVSGAVAPRSAAPPAAPRAAPAPRSAGDVEKALTSALRGDSGRQLSYVREHLTAEALQRFYRRAPLSPDLLAQLVRLLEQLAADDAARARELLQALAATPAARMQSEMFVAEEKGSLNRLVEKFGAEARAAWGLEEARQDGDEGPPLA